MNKKYLLATILGVSFLVGITRAATPAQAISQTQIAADEIADTVTPDNTNYDDQVMPLTNNDDSTTYDATAIIECTGDAYSSVCSNELVCETNPDGTESFNCEYALFSEIEYECGEYNEAGMRPCRKRTAEEIANIEHNGTSGEAEVICADENETDCRPEDNTEPELWPLILSVSALGFTILFVVIINLGKSKK